MNSGGSSIAWTGPIGAWGKMKPTLKRESANKCAYCEANTAVVAHGDVEHFRPKSVYWWLALCVDNYVFACQLCNQTYKKKHFPIHGTKLAAPRLPRTLPKDPARLKKLLSTVCPDPGSVDEKKLGAAWLKEKADLPHPYFEDPESVFGWAIVETNGEVHLVPADRSARAVRAAKAAVEYLGLNREQLRTMRYQIFATLRLAIKAWKFGNQGLRRDALKTIQTMCDGSNQFAGMCRFFARKAGVCV